MGEGYSATAEEPARYGHRAFTVPDFPKICDAAPGASRIDFDTSTMTLRVGDSFGLGDLPSVVASDGDGVVAEAVPVTIARTSGHESVDWCGNDQKWHVVAPGEIEVRVTGACPTHHRLRATLTIVIRAPSSGGIRQRRDHEEQCVTVTKAYGHFRAESGTRRTCRGA